MRELTNLVAETKKIMFTEIGFLKSDISFDKEDQYTILCLKQSKTNIKHMEMQIILAVTRECICLIAALR